MAVGSLPELLMEIHGDLVSLLDAKDIEGILKKLSRSLLSGVAYKDTITRRVRIESGASKFREEVCLYPDDEIKRIFKTFEVSKRGYSYGYLVIENYQLNIEKDFILSKRKIIIDVAIRSIANIAIRSLNITNKDKDEFLWNKLTENPIKEIDKIKKELEMFDFPIKSNIMVLSCFFRNNSSTTNKENIFLLINDIKIRIRSFFRKTLFYGKNNKFYVLLLLTDKQNEYDIFKNTKYAIEAAFASIDVFYEVFIGISSIKNSIFSLKEAIEESDIAVMHSLCENIDVSFWDKIGGFKILIKHCRSRDSRQFVNSWIGKLIEYDTINKSSYLETMRFLDKNNWNVSKTSREMKYHVNSIKYRYTKIGEILNLDLENNENRFNVSMAIRMHECIELLNSQEMSDDFHG